ncbi:hypothetical protein F0562_007081 [Nyssa sinensis]|uniref:PABS domain-containing protein n=1 Tax=Nyssa sinensis TaxID=561372 RepID=A0A5J5A1U9_9ASTE|nr:hypothetical protein F0562_007081 [Nyssa sinensis]
MLTLTTLDLLLPPTPRSRGRCCFCCCYSQCVRTFALPPVAKEILCCKTRYITLFSNFSLLNGKPNALQGPAFDLAEEDDDEQEFQVVTAVRSNYNDIVILDTPKSRMLLLDSTHNVHSIFNKEQKWTGSYWDEFASLPAIVPEGPIAIFGLGGGTAAHMMLEVWPSLQLDGWEIDEILIDKARDYLGLSDLEKHTQAGGILRVHVGDALSPSVDVPGGYAGIVIDLFSNGKVLPQLQEVATWFELNDKLMPNGRLMGRDDYLTGVAAPPRKEDPKYRTWKSENNMLMSWLINSITNEIGENFLLYVTAKDIWDTAKETYSSFDNSFELFAVESILHDLRQGDHMVTQYFNTLTWNGQQLDMFDKCDWKCPEDGIKYRKIIEKKRLYKFLLGLNKDLDEVRGRITGLKPLPSVREAFSEVRMEESRKKVMMDHQLRLTALKDLHSWFKGPNIKLETTDRKMDDLGAITAGRLVTPRRPAGRFMENPPDWKPSHPFNNRESRGHLASCDENHTQPK